MHFETFERSGNDLGDGLLVDAYMSDAGIIIRFVVGVDTFETLLEALGKLDLPLELWGSIRADVDLSRLILRVGGEDVFPFARFTVAQEHVGLLGALGSPLQIASELETEVAM